MLRYTGHPLVDVGVATITAFARKQDPSKLNEADLDTVADYITREYTRQPLMSFLTVAFPNSGFTQPAYRNQPEKQQTYAERTLRSYRPGTPTLDVADVFTGQPAVDITFDVKGELKSGYTFRQHIPLLTGENVINFFPGGDAGLPVSGTTMLALQAFPLGCAKCGGRLLAVHSDNDELVLHFARTFLENNRRTIQLAQAAGSSKMPESQLFYRTLLVQTLLEAREMQVDAIQDERLFSLTAYHLTNSGQGVGLDIYHLPLQIIGFLREMYQAEYHQEWKAIVQRAWEVAPPKKGGKKKSDDQPFQPRRNWLYEDLFSLPEGAPRFLRTYFLRVAIRYAAKSQATDPRTAYSLQRETNLVSWKITERFLRRVLNMDPERIEHIRTMGDRLAEYVSTQNDRRFFREFFTLQRYDFLRNALIKANLTCVRQGGTPLITLDPYIAVFEEGDELARSGWRLARDLVLIRMVEKLHTQGWLGQNISDIPELAEAESTQEQIIDEEE